MNPADASEEEAMVFTLDGPRKKDWRDHLTGRETAENIAASAVKLGALFAYAVWRDEGVPVMGVATAYALASSIQAFNRANAGERLAKENKKPKPNRVVSHMRHLAGYFLRGF